MDCDVAIVGGGLAGLYMAESLLRHKKETKVCVFERDVRLGGRIFDYVFPQVPDEVVGKCNDKVSQCTRLGRTGVEYIKSRLCLTYLSGLAFKMRLSAKPVFW